MKRLLILLTGIAALLTLTSSPASATVCEDGWISPSTGSGTCSWHGGIEDGLPSWDNGSTYNDGLLEGLAKDSARSSGYLAPPVEEKGTPLDFRFWTIIGLIAFFWVWLYEKAGY